MAEMIINSIIDHIPLWGWMLIIGVPVAALLYFFHPILIPIWNMLPLWLRVALVGIVGGIFAYFAGRHTGRDNAEQEQRKRDAEALRKRNEVDREVDNLSDKQNADRLRDRWTRDGD